MVDKSKIIVDYEKQNKEKNMWWGDFPCKRIDTGRKLEWRLAHYFDSWKDYLINGAEGKRFEWEIEVLEKFERRV